MPGLEQAIQSIKSEVGSELRGYVLDLRNNPGGLLDQAVEVSDAFIDQGEIVSTRGRAADDTQRFNSTPGDQNGRAHVGTPVTNAQIVLRLLLEKQKSTSDSNIPENTVYTT